MRSFEQHAIAGLALVVFVFIPVTIHVLRGAQEVTNAYEWGPTLPSTCSVGARFFKTVAPNVGTHECRAADVWSAPASGVPSGAILLTVGSCPTGYSEVSSLDGRTLVGTLAAHGDVGGTGGVDSVTPIFTGTPDSLTHTGTAVAAHADHTHTYTQVPNHVHPYRSQTATTGSVASYEHGAVDTSSTSAVENGISTDNPTGGVSTGTTNGASASLTHSVTQPTTHSYTPAGTIGAVDNRSAFTRVIFCQAN